MGFRSFLFKHSGTGKRLQNERTDLKQKLTAARDQIAALRGELKQAIKNTGQPPPRAPELEAELTAAIAAKLTENEPFPDFKAVAGRVSVALSEFDVMLKKVQPVRYLDTAIAGMQALYAGIDGLVDHPPRRILDFGCGYGRVARFMQAAWPQAELRVCDVDFSGVAFCLSHLGMKGFQVGTDPRHMDLGTGYDLIWLGSVVTHLDAPVITDLLKALPPALAPGGHLVFTSHGDRVVQNLIEGKGRYDLLPADEAHVIKGYQETGFSYADYPGVQGYGVSATHVDWLRQKVAATPGLEWVRHMPRAWQSQDVVVCKRPA